LSLTAPNVIWREVGLGVAACDGNEDIDLLTGQRLGTRSAQFVDRLKHPNNPLARSCLPLTTVWASHMARSGQNESGTEIAGLPRSGKSQAAGLRPPSLGLVDIQANLQRIDRPHGGVAEPTPQVS